MASKKDKSISKLLNGFYGNWEASCPPLSEALELFKEKCNKEEQNLGGVFTKELLETTLKAVKEAPLKAGQYYTTPELQAYGKWLEEEQKKYEVYGSPGQTHVKAGDPAYAHNGVQIGYFMEPAGLPDNVQVSMKTTNGPVKVVSYVKTCQEPAKDTDTFQDGLPYDVFKRSLEASWSFRDRAGEGSKPRKRAEDIELAM